MKSYLVLSAMGSDRPGIVSEVSEYLLQQGGNLEDSRMAVLGGEFALVVLVSGPPEKMKGLQAGFPPFAAERQMTATAKPTTGPETRRSKGFVPFLVRGAGLDHEGIVYHIAHTLHGLGANIDSMETQSASAPVSGAPMFTFHMQVTVPPEISLADLRSHLQQAGDEVNIDLTIHTA